MLDHELSSDRTTNVTSPALSDLAAVGVQLADRFAAPRILAVCVAIIIFTACGGTTGSTGRASQRSTVSGRSQLQTATSTTATTSPGFTLADVHVGIRDMATDLRTATHDPNGPSAGCQSLLRTSRYAAGGYWHRYWSRMAQTFGAAFSANMNQVIAYSQASFQSCARGTGLDGMIQDGKQISAHMGAALRIVGIPVSDSLLGGA